MGDQKGWVTIAFELSPWWYKAAQEVAKRHKRTVEEELQFALVVGLKADSHDYSLKELDQLTVPQLLFLLPKGGDAI